MPYLGVRPADITSATEAEIAGDLTVDTNTLKVDATNNRVGVGTSSPGHPLAITASGATSTFSVNPSSNLTVIGTSQSSATNSDLYIDTKGTGSHIFRYNAGGAEIARFTSGGLAIGGTGSSNTLNDYEEGTWTPTVSTGYSSVPTYVAQQGTYTKIGRLVTCHCRLEISAGTQAGSAFSITGLPFTVRSTNPNGGGFTTYQNNFHSSDDFYPFADSNSTSIFFHEENGTAVNANELDGTAWEIRMIIIYEQN